ncbi:peptidoglycan-binding protein [Demetria terragena]|uniref:peptidoglycan-binding protein n=1 Tax=Demetria terragena TaxID=63959 RepID=UPI0003787151|nr:peptidoglycan-binding protein [Demetria terragena]
MSTNTTLDRRTLLKIAGAGALGAAAIGTVGHSPIASAAAHKIVPRADWGFDGWQAGGPPSLDKAAITNFVVHYHGASGANVNGPQAPRNIHAMHKADDPNNSGILYNFIITQKGEIFGARGYEFRSGSQQDANEFSISAQVHIHGGTKPTPEALAALTWLYRHSHGKLGTDKALKITGHSDHVATTCPGGPLGTWIDGPGQKLYQEMKKKLGGAKDDDPSAPEFPGADAFQLGKSHPAVKTLDEGLIRKGFDKHHDGDGYQAGTTFSKYTRSNVQDFQKAQGWSGSGADGYPGAQTWKLLTS